MAGPAAGGWWLMADGRWGAVKRQWPTAASQWTVEGERMGCFAHGRPPHTKQFLRASFFHYKGGHFFILKIQERRKRSKVYASYCNIFED